ncbi:hypothetical protein WA026_014697, partial [Henosepilachna vigintioctopunctata]
MSYQPVAPSRHRSSSAARTTSSGYGSRPRSMGFYGNTSPYSSPYSTATSSPYSSSLSNYGGGYSSNYTSPYFQNGYRSNASSGGYASLTIPAKAFATNYNVLAPNYAKNYTKGAHRSRRDSSSSRGGSLRDRDRSASRSRSTLSGGSGLGSKSISLTSLNSEGYV